MCAGKHTLRCRPKALSLNCNHARMSIIDENGILSFYQFQNAAGSDQSKPEAPSTGEHLAFERKVSHSCSLELTSFA